MGGFAFELRQGARPDDQLAHLLVALRRRAELIRGLLAPSPVT
jgi:hypothetical protein